MEEPVDTPAVSTPRPLIVACDESGNDGENVLGGSSTVLAHASVTLSTEEARELVSEVRARTGCRSLELKSKTLLQPKNQATAKWLLEHELLKGRASIHLTYKEYFLVSKLFDSTIEELAHELGEDMYASGGALAGANILFFLAPQFFGQRWRSLLLSFQLFLRSRDAQEAQASLKDVFSRTEELLFEQDSPLRDVIGPMYIGLKHLQSLSLLQLGRGIEYRLRTGDPLLAAVGATVKFWAETSGCPVLVIHDSAKELTEHRVESMRFHLARPELIAPSKQGTGCELVDIVLADSANDPRVQVADLLAGLGRVVAERLALGVDHALQSQLEPMISYLSIWPVQEHMDVETARQTMNANHPGPD